MGHPHDFLRFLCKLEVEADAKGKGADGAGFGVVYVVIVFVVIGSACGLVGGGSRNVLKVVLCGFGVVEGTGAKEVVVETGTDVATEIGTGANREGEGSGGFVFKGKGVDAGGG